MSSTARPSASGTASTASKDSSSATSRPPTRGEVEALLACRAEAWNAVDHRRLERCLAPKSPALTSDSTALRQAERDGIAYSGVSYRVANYTPKAANSSATRGCPIRGCCSAPCPISQCPAAHASQCQARFPIRSIHPGAARFIRAARTSLAEDPKSVRSSSACASCHNAASRAESAQIWGGCSNPQFQPTKYSNPPGLITLPKPPWMPLMHIFGADIMMRTRSRAVRNTRHTIASLGTYDAANTRLELSALAHIHPAFEDD